jgi:hypothetical protein
MLQFIKHELSMEQSQFNTTQKDIFIEYSYRRDFRLLKLDPITKQVVANPIVWVEMNGTEIVRKNLLISICICFL